MIQYQVSHRNFYRKLDVTLEIQITWRSLQVFQGQILPLTNGMYRTDSTD